MTMSAAADAGFAFLQSVREEIEAVGEDANLYSGEHARTRYYAKHRDSVDGRPEWDSTVNGELFEHAYDALVIFIDAAQAHIVTGETELPGTLWSELVIRGRDRYRAFASVG